jgi:hypothetical protein
MLRNDQRAVRPVAGPVPSFAIAGLRQQAANTLRGAGLKQFLSVSCNFGSLLLSLKRFDSGLPEPTTLCPLPDYP